MALFDFLTKEGRERIVARREQKRKARYEEERRAAREEFERQQRALPRYAQAHRWFEDHPFHYDLAESKRKDVMYLNMAMQAIDASEKTTNWYGQEISDPLGNFHSWYFNFVNYYFADHKCVNALVNEEYKFVRIDDVERIILWARDHGDDCARMFLYELRVMQNRIEEAIGIRHEAEYLKQTPWFWKRVDLEGTLERCREQSPQDDKTESVASRWAHIRTGDDFEKFILWRLKSKNIVCDQIGGSGDQGVDILVYGCDHKVAIQCKFYSHPVDNAAVQQVFAGMKYYGCAKALVVSNAEYTPGAIDLARKTGVKLCSHLNFLEELKEYGCDDEGLDEWTPMGTMRGIREAQFRNPRIII